MSVIAKKICLVGDFAVGKTSLIRRFVDRQFSDKYLTTVGMKLSRKTVTIDENLDKEKKVDLLIWDLEGQTQFKGIAPTYLQGSAGGILVGDVTRLETIEHLENHVKLFSKINPKGLIIIAFNKVDLISDKKLEKIIDEHNFQDNPNIITHYSTSAKTGSYVDDMFLKLAISILVK